MGSWTRFVKMVDTGDRYQQAVGQRLRSGEATNSAYQNVKANLPEVYRGAQNRMDRLRQFDQMDLDPIVNAGLDILADFVTQNSDDGEIFEIEYTGELSTSIKDTLELGLERWSSLQQLNARGYDIIRDAFKYGDFFLIRDPETLELHAVQPFQVDKIVVDEAKGKHIDFYYVKDISLNLQEQVATLPMNQVNLNQYGNTSLPPTVSSTGPSYSGFQNSGYDSRFNSGMTVTPVPAEHVVHLSMNSGSDFMWPFGRSVLESIWKVYKQKELLEDAVVIYRLVRAPERRVFKVDVGDLPVQKAQQAVERFKNEIHQRRGLSKTRSNMTTMDVGYDPMSMTEDFFLPVRGDGKGPSIETLPGGASIGEITDLSYFNNQLIRGLKIPSSYLPYGDQDGTTTWNDGKIGAVMVQEIRFAKYCQRLQQKLVSAFDREFKYYLKKKGFIVDSSQFRLKFRPPMNFSDYAKLEIMNTRVALFTQLVSTPFISKRYLLEEVMGWSPEDFSKNQKYWIEENKTKLPQEASDLISDSLPDIKSLAIDKTTPEDRDDQLNDVGMDTPEDTAELEGELDV